MLDRRQWIQAAGGLAGALAASRLFGRRAWADPAATLPFVNGERPLVAYPGKRPLHSRDYITTQPPHKGKDFWTAEVTKMVNVYGAPIPETERAAIAEYLAATY